MIGKTSGRPLADGVDVFVTGAKIILDGAIRHSTQASADRLSRLAQAHQPSL